MAVPAPGGGQPSEQETREGHRGPCLHIRHAPQTRAGGPMVPNEEPQPLAWTPSSLGRAPWGMAMSPGPRSRSCQSSQSRRLRCERPPLVHTPSSAETPAPGRDPHGSTCTQTRTHTHPTPLWLQRTHPAMPSRFKGRPKPLQVPKQPCSGRVVCKLDLSSGRVFRLFDMLSAEVRSLGVVWMTGEFEMKTVF